jgi:superfamily I DNA and/or RNA helicase
MVEEAGEILEAHVLSALSSSTRHAILIGDHLQLRPKVGGQAVWARGEGQVSLLTTSVLKCAETGGLGDGARLN